MLSTKSLKFINLYATIFSYVCSLRNISIEQEKIDTIINYYESGVFTNVGNYLSNHGFPIVTIKVLEDKIVDDMNLEINDFKLKFQSNELKLNSILDDYEKRLLQNLMSVE